MKYYYSISEVAKLVDVPTYVLRYWEQEFRGLHPKKTNSGRRVYTQKDIDSILLIKELLYEKHYTIKGAKELLSSKVKSEKLKVKNDILKEIEEGLKEVLNILGSSKSKDES